ncbi:hypothetical protein EJ05DRAFT_487834 [Pseudovirgaria hyperparasitica]|uniref:Transcription factor domain-containing protein n=1 Tax=Pseudovirgaria hyperparasitica TaxID=470096 RepID=A0A6A6VZE3_9PEZI|nr:uncharacterized protein EJ05DRAFT_487834 [Pseudovirgaria hyperparasitica]KAF2756022.1 hypothetical protein EJ05DRAFT_487834 [Pseudovirgaria hyperparasitica]
MPPGTTKEETLYHGRDKYRPATTTDHDSHKSKTNEAGSVVKPSCAEFASLAISCRRGRVGRVMHGISSGSAQRAKMPVLLPGTAKHVACVHYAEKVKKKSGLYDIAIALRRDTSHEYGAVETYNAQCSSTCSYNGSPPRSSHYKAPSPQLSPSPIIISNDNDNNNATSTPARHMLDLELLHHWTTHTYATMVAVPQDAFYLAVEVPRGGMQYSYMLHGILAISALEKAYLTSTNNDINNTSSNTATTATYLRAAMEYYDTASASFRGQIGAITEHSAHVFYMFSMLVGMINLAIPQFRNKNNNNPAIDDDVTEWCSSGSSSVLGHIGTLFALYVHGAAMAVGHWDWLMTSPLAPSLVSAMELIRMAPRGDLDADTQLAMARVAEVVALATTPTPIPTTTTTDTGTTTATIPPQPQPPQDLTYPLALSSLNLCFVETAKDAIKFFCISFPFAAGRAYTRALARREPLALFLLMHWAVLLDRMGREAWWARAVGRRLVVEIAGVLEREGGFEGCEAWWEGIEWCRGRVGCGRGERGEGSGGLIGGWEM